MTRSIFLLLWLPLLGLVHGFSTPNPKQQAEYGKTLEMPDSYVQCGSCQSAFAVTGDDLGAGGKGRYVDSSACFVGFLLLFIFDSSYV